MDRRRLSFLLVFLLLLCSIGIYKLPVTAAVRETPITRNLFYSNYSSSNYYINTCILQPSENEPGYYWDDGLQLRANCYGYAYRLFYEYSTFGDEGYYMQQPGEFARKTSGIDIYNDIGDTLITSVYNYRDLRNLYINSIHAETENNDEKMNVLVQLMRADANALGFSMTSCPESDIANGTTSSSRRLIAVVVGGNDYHFYMQHSDGTWSHKQGSLPPSNKCLCSSAVTLRNSNIVSHACQGPYTNGLVRFFYITKNTVIDYGHDYGHSDNSTKTNIYNTDRAGNDFKTSEDIGTIPLTSRDGYIDFCGDIDYYYFSSASTKNFTFTFSTSSSFPLTTILYSESGETLASQTANNGSISFTCQLQSGKKYFIKISTSNQTEHEYQRIYTFSIT